MDEALAHYLEELVRYLRFVLVFIVAWVVYLHCQINILRGELRDHKTGTTPHSTD